MDVTQTQGAQNAAASTAAANNRRTLGKEDFLRLLIAQLNNQDPLTPMQSEQFVAQLAQFSSLEQMQNMNSKLEEAIQSDMLLSQVMNNSLVTTLIGKEVKVQSDTFTLGDDGDAVGGFQTGSAATKVTVEIRDGSGNVVRTLELGALPAGDHSIRWDGKNEKGQRVAAGDYTFSVKAVGADGAELPVIQYLRGTITGVRYDQGSAYLLMDGMAYPLGNVLEILKPA